MELTDETLQKFLETIEARSRQELDELNNTHADRSRAAAQAAQKAADAKGEQIRFAEMAKIQNVGELRVQARRTENRAALLSYRRQCQDETAAAVREKLAAFTQTAEYAQLLRERLSGALADLGAQECPADVYLRREDLPLADSLGAGKNVRFAEGNFSLGGLIVSVPSVSRRADMTFDTALRLAQDRFAEIADMQL